MVSPPPHQPQKAPAGVTEERMVWRISLCKENPTLRRPKATAAHKKGAPRGTSRSPPDHLTTSLLLEPSRSLRKCLLRASWVQRKGNRAQGIYLPTGRQSTGGAHASNVGMTGVRGRKVEGRDTDLVKAKERRAGGRD